MEIGDEQIVYPRACGKKMWKKDSNPEFSDPKECGPLIAMPLIQLWMLIWETLKIFVY